MRSGPGDPLGERGAIWVPSPNWGDRRGAGGVDIVVLHHTGMETAGAALARLCTPEAEVSAHYLIAEDGQLWQMVDERARAWHAGAGHWAGVADVNSRSVGIELANPGWGVSAYPFPEPQMARLEALLDGVMARWGIPPERVVGHACIAPLRKNDPSGRFDWRRLARGRRAVWPEAGSSAAGGPLVQGIWPRAARFQAAAAAFGYGVGQTGRWDPLTLAAWRAFARRFRPCDPIAEPNEAGLAVLETLAARWPAARG